jgi:hypothetical protein
MNDPSGIVELHRLIAGMRPELLPERYVFVSLPNGKYGDGTQWHPVASVDETEGLTLVLERNQAERAGLPYSGVFSMLVLRVHSSLHAVGLTAAVSDALARRDIAANVIAGAFHDRVLVPEQRATEALAALEDLVSGAGS